MPRPIHDFRALHAVRALRDSDACLGAQNSKKPTARSSLQRPSGTLRLCREVPTSSRAHKGLPLLPQLEGCSSAGRRGTLGCPGSSSRLFNSSIGSRKLNLVRIVPSSSWPSAVLLLSSCSAEASLTAGTAISAERRNEANRRLERVCWMIGVLCRLKCQSTKESTLCSCPPPRAGRINTPWTRKHLSFDFKELQRGGELAAFVFHEGHYLLALDGTEYFCSDSIHCPCCLCRESTTRKKTYDHQLLAAALVKPGKSTTRRMESRICRSCSPS